MKQPVSNKAARHAESTVRQQWSAREDAVALTPPPYGVEFADRAVPRRLEPSSGGQAIPKDVRARMEEAFGEDFSHVRLHEDPLAQSVGALAAARGPDIHFAPGLYAPHSQQGQQLLGHELAHVVQQASGQVSATTHHNGVGINTDGGLEREADEMAVKAARGERVRLQHPPSGTAASAPEAAAVQRKVTITDKRPPNVLDAAELLVWLQTVRPLKPDKDKPPIPLSPQVTAALKQQLAIWDGENRTFKTAAIQKEVKSIIETPDKPTPHTLPATTGSTEGLKSSVVGIEPKFDQERFESMLLKGMAGITISDVKAYLELNESKTHDLYRKIAMEIRSRTYKQSRQAIEFEPFFRLGLPEQLEVFKRYRAENERIDKEEETWTAKEVPVEMLLAIRKDKLHQQQERETTEQRGLPADVLGKTLAPRTVSEQQTHEQFIRKSLPHITADTESKGFIIAQVLAKGQLTVAMNLLLETVTEILILMDPLWSQIKKQGRLAIVDMVMKKTNDIGDIKGAIGELNAILFALTSGGRSVNTGGKDKKLPLMPGQRLGGISTQDIDVRYVTGEERTYMEAKYDAKTLIDKYRGTYTPKIKADVGDDKAPPYKEMLTEWLETHAATLGIEIKTKTTTKKPAVEKKEPEHLVVDRPLGIAPQQARYQAMRDKPRSAQITSRGLSAAIANTHDWLLLFIPKSNGSLVSTRLSNEGWTIVVGDVALDPSRVQLLLQTVEGLTEDLNRDEAEAWAERTSKTLKPADFLSHIGREVISLYLNIKRDLPGYERLIRDMPEGNYKRAAIRHYEFGRWCFTTADLANLQEAGEKLAVAQRQLREAQDKVYEERIEKDRAARYGSTSYGN
jgi:hypothetical protein